LTLSWICPAFEFGTFEILRDFSIKVQILSYQQYGTLMAMAIIAIQVFSRRRVNAPG
jgi:hypothetical protein